jgi:hypothetical protein
MEIVAPTGRLVDGAVEARTLYSAPESHGEVAA